MSQGVDLANVYESCLFDLCAAGNDAVDMDLQLEKVLLNKFLNF